MNKPQLLLDTNIVIDFLNMREPFFRKRPSTDGPRKVRGI